MKHLKVFEYDSSFGDIDGDFGNPMNEFLEELYKTNVAYKIYYYVVDVSLIAIIEYGKVD